MTRTLPSVRTLALLGTVLLLALSGPAQAVAPALSTASTSNDDVDTASAALVADTAFAAEAGDEEILVTRTLRRAPEDPDTIIVNITIDDPDLEVGMEFSPPDEATVRNATVRGFERSYGGWEVTGDETPRTLTYEMPTAELNYEAGGPEESWAVMDSFGGTDEYPTLSDVPTYTYETTVRNGTLGGDSVYFGEYESATASTDSGTIRIIESGAVESPESPQTVANEIANASDQIEAGGGATDVTGFAIPPTRDNASGWAWDTEFYVDSQKSVYGGTTWMHEYVHTSESIGLAEDMRWFTEGYATFGEIHYSLEAGIADYGDFRNQMRRGSSQSAVLVDNTTWEENNTQYPQGAVVLGALDRQIRLANESGATIQDVVALMEADDDVTVDEFVGFVRQTSNDTVAERARTWITTQETPSTWSHSQHEAAVGPVPNITTTTATNASVETTNGSRPIDGDGSITLSPNETITIDAMVRNDGGSPGHYDQLMTAHLGDTDTQHTGGWIGANTAEEKSASHRFIDTGSYVVETSSMLYQVDVEVTSIDGTMPTDPDGDGQFEDVNGNGELDYDDVTTLNEHVGEPAVENHVSTYDFNLNGEIDYGDVTTLYEQV